MLSPAVEQICQQHYGSWRAKHNGCHRCPIRDQCITDKPVRTEQELAEWRKSINDAAAALDKYSDKAAA